MGAKHLSLARVFSANGASPSEMVGASCFSTGVGDAQGSVCLLRGSVVPWFAPKAERELQFCFLYMLMSSAALAAAKPGGGAQLRAACGPKNWQRHLQKDREKPWDTNQPSPAQSQGAVTHLCSRKGDAALQEGFPVG